MYRITDDIGYNNCKTIKWRPQNLHFIQLCIEFLRIYPNGYTALLDYNMLRTEIQYRNLYLIL